MRFFSTCLIFLISFTLRAQQEMYDICPIKNSEALPEATVFTSKGESQNLKEYIGNRKAVIVFYRGAWCPYCIRHLSALKDIMPEMNRLGVELIAVTPDDYSHLNLSDEKAGGLDYTLFSDKNVNAITAFGIGWKINDELYQKYKDKYDMDTEWWTGASHHILPVPSVFVVSEGKIAYQHVDPNYSQRLSPELLLSMIRSLK